MRVERGEVSAEAVIIVPVVFLILLFGVQVATVFHAANIATAAAAQGAAAAAAMGGDAISGERVATMSVAELGGRLNSIPVVHVGADIVEVSVRIDVPQIVPGFPSDVVRTVSEQRELFIEEADR